MHIAEADETRLLALVRDAAELAYEGRYAGVSWRDLERYDRYAEPGFSLIKEDKHLTQLQHLPPP